MVAVSAPLFLKKNPFPLLVHCTYKRKYLKNSFALHRFVFLLNKRYTQDSALSMLIRIYLDLYKHSWMPFALS